MVDKMYGEAQHHVLQNISYEIITKDEKAVPIGSQVRLVNLPKKRKIDRDLKSAFQGIPGIVNIVPAVIGNKKTRDPICKGFAFVDFKHEEDAVRCVLNSTM
ncbi:hypothetical protein KIW84_023315 [Lathyrus oleraceus]|uniref:RRM domain-containing protein n=1 Tax=Pisum sativum TaxID=3888 RepID=A0A9D4YDV0_PEA|nr:hypothetical protein KIW84_023315 [Pisum sativum]